MKSYIVFVYLVVCGVIAACNNAGESRETTDSSTIKDNTINADTAHRMDTGSYDRMREKTDSSRKY